MAERSGRPPRAAGLLLAALLAGACSAGVPPTGKVHGVRPVPAQPGAGVPAAPGGGSGPRRGQGEVEVVRGLFTDMASLAPGQIARWMVADARVRQQVARLTSADASIGIYQDVEIEPASAGRAPGERDVPVLLNAVGTVAHAQDWLPSATEATLTLRLRQERGQWRVIDPPAQLWLSATDFGERFARRNVFMVAGDGVRLTPTPAFVRIGGGGQEMARRAERTLVQLLRGPSQRLRRTLGTAIPDGTVLRGFSYGDGLATVDLSSDFATPQGSGVLRVGQVVWTVTDVIGNASVRLLVEGHQPGQLGTDRFAASGHLNRVTPALAALRPAPAGSPASLLFVRNGTVYTLGAALDGGARPRVVPYTAAPVSAPTWSPDGARVAFLAGSGPRRTLWIGQPPGVGRGPRASATPLTGDLSAPTWLPSATPPRVLALRRAAGMELWSVDAAGAAHAMTRLQLPPLPHGEDVTELRVSPDGAWVLAVAASGRRFGDDGLLYLGLLSRTGVDAWLDPPVSVGRGRVSSPVWVDDADIAFIARSGTTGDLAELCMMKADGWDPIAILDPNRSTGVALDIGDQLTVDPTGDQFIFTVRAETSTSLWEVESDGRSPRALTHPPPGGMDADVDPDFASR